MKKRILALTLCLGLFSVFTNSMAWNALGHRLIAQIAYNHLTPQTKRICNDYNHALDEQYPPVSFVNAAPWLDTLHDKYPKLKEQHYISFPFSKDGTPLVPYRRNNGVKGIYRAMHLIQSKSSDRFTKGFALRILLHVVGDLHQPLHAATHFSKDHPNGDRGGNFHTLGHNRTASNLHAYWDKGGGLLQRIKPYPAVQVRRAAYSIEKRWPCKLQCMDINPMHWARESHQLAIDKAYQVGLNEKPSKAYEKMARLESEQRIALAGCRLAALLNQLDLGD